MALVRKYFSEPDVEEIFKIKPSSTRQEDDVLAWGPDRRGIFSVKSAYRLTWDLKHRTSSCAASRAPDGNRVVWNIVWGCPAPPKVRVFAWRLATNSLATWENKKKRNLEISDICVVCGLEREDTYHTFCRCPMARQLWEAMREVWALKEQEAITNTGPEWLLQALDQASEQERLMMLMTFWRIWHVRNEVVHQKPAPPVEASRRFLCSYVESLMMIKQHPSADLTKGKEVLVYDHMKPKGSVKMMPRKQADALKKWSKPPPGWIKLNVDGSWEIAEHRGGTGMVLRDEEGSIIFTACSYLKVCASPIEAEAIACREGLALALESSERPIIVESDCLELTSMIQADGVNRSPIAAIVNEIKKLCNGDRVCLIKHISREVNDRGGGPRTAATPEDDGDLDRVVAARGRPERGGGGSSELADPWGVAARGHQRGAWGGDGFEAADPRGVAARGQWRGAAATASRRQIPGAWQRGDSGSRGVA
ncbi:hypothetical protein ACQ4PT_029504 [Festuca glaucescens]